MKFRISTGEIKTRQIVELEESQKLGDVLRMMAKFAIEENGQRIPEAVAFEALLDLSLDEQIRAQEAFTQALLPLLKRGMS